MHELYRPKCLRADYTPVSLRVKEFVTSERARQIIGHSLKMIQKFDKDFNDRNISKEEETAIYRYVACSNTWTDITDDQGQWDDVTTFVNSNETLRLSFICGSQIRLTLIK